MKTKLDIVKIGDKILDEFKKQPNNIFTQLKNTNEEITFNTGFFRGFEFGFDNSESLYSFLDWFRNTDFNCEGHSTEDVVKEYLKNVDELNSNK